MKLDQVPTIDTRKLEKERADLERRARDPRRISKGKTLTADEQQLLSAIHVELAKRLGHAQLDIRIAAQAALGQANQSGEQHENYEKYISTAEWAITRFQPLLQKTINHQNLEFIAHAADCLDKKRRDQWMTAFSLLQEKMLRDADWFQWRYAIKQFHILNQKFFVQHGLYMHLEPKQRKFSDNPRQMWNCDTHVLQLLQNLRFTVCDGEFNVFFVKPFNKTLDINSSYSAECKSITMSLADSEMREIWGLRNHGQCNVEVPQRTLYEKAGYAYQRYFIDTYPDEKGLQQVMVSSCLTEEIRHAITAMRNGIEEIRTMDYTEKIRKLISRGGHRSKLQSALIQLQNPQNPSFFEISAMTLQCTAFDELSGHMTSAAVGPDPYIVLLKWRAQLYGLERGTVEAAYYHMAASYATVLLSEYAGLGTVAPLSQLARLSPDNGYLAPYTSQSINALERLMRLPANRLRKIMKNVYEREFSEAIDEDPFPKITPDGSLQGTPIGSDLVFD